MRRSALILAFAAGLFATPAIAADEVALVVGSNAYQHAPQLKNARGDAERIATVLEGIGFEVIKVFDADKRTLEDAMNAFAEKAKSARIGLVYYAGHGIQFEGNVYLVPTDVDLGNERDIRNTIPADYLVSDASRASELGLVILDACRDSPFVKQLAEDVGPTRSMSVNRGLTRINAVPTKSLVAYSTQSGNVALDGDGANSPYATALAEHLATPGKDVRLIFGAVRDDVVKATDGKQEPFIYGSLGGSEIYLATAGPTSDPGPADAGPQLAELDLPETTTALAPDFVAWRKAMKADRWPVLQQAVADQPDGLFAAIGGLLLERQGEYDAPSAALAAEGRERLSLTRLPRPAVEAIQSALRDLDFTGASIDGSAGPKTAKALEAFAEAAGIDATASLDLIVALGERAATRPSTSPFTGVWTGRYEYTDGRDGVDFTQELTFSQGLVTGFVSEPNTFGDGTSKNLYATLAGSVSGNAIEWVKTYDGTAGVSHSVEYGGTLDRTKRTIVGRWKIGALSGPFTLSLQ